MMPRRRLVPVRQHAFALVALLALGVFSVGMVAPIVSPSSAFAQSATPVAGDAGSLASLLQLAPDQLSEPDQPAFQIVAYADAATQLRTLGVTAPESIDADPEAVRTWLGAVDGLLLTDFIVSRNSQWRAVFGFDLFQVDQSLTIGEPPSAIALMRGRFDHDAIVTALTTAGYQSIDDPDAEIYSLSPEPTIDMDSDIGRLALARMNNVAFLPDGTLVCAPSLALVEQTIAVATGAEPSLGDRPEVQSLLAAQTDPLVSAVIVPGVVFANNSVGAEILLSGTPVNIEEIATRIAITSEMPPIVLALLGMTAGGPLRPLGDSEPLPAPADQPRARFDVNLLMLDHASAERAVEVAMERLATASSLATQRPLSSYFADWTGEVAPNESVAHLEINFAPDTRGFIWYQMLAQRDVVFLAW